MIGRPTLLRLLAGLAWAGAAARGADPAPLRVVVAGFEHGHVGGFLKGADPRVVTIVGAWEADDAVWARYRRDPRLAHVHRFPTVEAAVEATGAEAVWAFTDTRGHLEVARAALPHHAALIVEKPLAIGWAQAAEMASLARSSGALLLTNYETSWYPGFADARALLRRGTLGTVRQVYLQMGHQGPVEIGVQPEFLAWLVDPARAGGGALFDFGCYGADVATWWADNRAPESVTAFTATYDRVHYPTCDDHAVIELSYPEHEVTITASWHWPFSRKDASIYGDRGAWVAPDGQHYTLQMGKGPALPQTVQAAHRSPLEWFAGVIRRGRDPADDPSSLATNLVAVKIMEAARRSAQEHRTVRLLEIN